MSALLALHSRLNQHAAVLAALVAVCATLAVAALVVMTGDTLRSKDEADFVGIAQNLASMAEFSLIAGEPTAYRAPGIIFFITPAIAFGGGLVEARLMTAAAFGLGLWFLFCLVRRHASPFAGLLAVVMVPLWPVTVYTATTIYPQTLAAVLLVATLLAVDRLHDDGAGWGRAVIAGLAYGALVLTLPVVLLLMPLFLFWIFWRSREWLTAGVIFCVVSGSVVSAWTARNYLAFDAFVPVATSSGYNLLAGNAPNARYDTSLNVRFPEYVYTEITGKSEIEREEIMRQAAFDLIAADPERFIRLYVGKFLHWFDYSNRLMSDDVLEEGASNIDVSARELILLASYLVVIVLPLLLHLAMMRRVPFRAVEVLFLAFWIAAGLAYALYFTRVRFRAPFDWLIISSNAMFIAGWIELKLAGLRDRKAARA